MAPSSSVRASMCRCGPGNCRGPTPPRCCWPAAAVDRERLLAAVLDEFGVLLDRWTAAAGDIDASGLRADYRAACGTIGARVRLQLPGGGQVVGQAVDVAVDGSLVIADAFGVRSSYSAADVVHLRPDR